MQELEVLPEVIGPVYHSLEPFSKNAQDVAQIRRVLALHLSSYVNPRGRIPISQPLSLLESGFDVRSASSGVRGIRREYLRCARANIDAREEYEKIRKEHHQPAESQYLKCGNHNESHDSSGDSLELFLDIVKYRRKHERLRILQDYVDMLAQKPAAAANHLDPQVILKEVDSLPSVPSDLMISSVPLQESQQTDLNDLVDQLEKSVLRAKLLLMREQKLLAKVQAERKLCNTSSASPGNRLQALGTARNELINWIETELAKAGESPADSGSGQVLKSSENNCEEFIDDQLARIQRQYATYTKARQALIVAATESLDALASTTMGDDMKPVIIKEEVEKASIMSYILHPYLEELTSVSNQQKSMIQQKSYLTISLAKQLKEAGQGLDRLAEESHLLPSYPLAASERNPTSFGEEISSYERPNSSHRARSWVHASELAGKSTKEAVSENRGEGERAILDARQNLLNIWSLLGDAVDTESANDTSAESKSLAKDIWAMLDGHLGVITHDVIDS